MARVALAASGVNRYLPTPDISVMGKKTIVVVTAASSTGSETSAALSRAACCGVLPMFR